MDEESTLRLGWAPKNPVKELARIRVDVDGEVIGAERWWEGKKVLGERYDGWNYWKGNLVELMQADS